LCLLNRKSWFVGKSDKFPAHKSTSTVAALISDMDQISGEARRGKAMEKQSWTDFQHYPEANHR
jgi:hypothetical protein